MRIFKRILGLFIFSSTAISWHSSIHKFTVECRTICLKQYGSQSAREPLVVVCQDRVSTPHFLRSGFSRIQGILLVSWASEMPPSTLLFQMGVRALRVGASPSPTPAPDSVLAFLRECDSLITRQPLTSTAIASSARNSGGISELSPGLS